MIVLTNARPPLYQSGFRDIVLALAATYGLYILSSILHFDPWHLVTSFLQYLLLVPSFIIVLTIYSFANTHDLAWYVRSSPPTPLLEAFRSCSKSFD